MLTESELAWLVQRNPRGKVGDMFFSCHNCDEADKNPRRTKYKTCRYRCKIHKTHKYELQDALEFSERVAEKLAINDTSYLPCHQKGHENQCPYDNYCPTNKMRTAWCKLKHARLQVEEEMNAD